MNSVYLRPLEIADARTSYKWRNNPMIWKFTRYKPDKQITEAVETTWLENTLNAGKDHRFAICLKPEGKYLGNVQITDIKNKNGEFHLFIGDPSFWGKGIGRAATSLMLDYGFNTLKLDFIWLDVHQDNLKALSIYEKIGFRKKDQTENFIYMTLTSGDYLKLQQSNKSALNKSILYRDIL